MADVAKAGGGLPSTTVARESIDSFSPVLMSHLKRIHAEICKGDTMVQTQAEQFLRDIQQAPGDTSTPLHKPESDFADFLRYMGSPECNAMGAGERPDYSHPISNYFISTSHNTYLTSNQLYGVSSARAYKDVLLRGCRCLEIDVWDGEEEESDHRANRRSWAKEKVKSGLNKVKGRNRSQSLSQDKSSIQAAATTSGPALARTPPAGSKPKRIEPRVLHGHTLTKEVSFREVCTTIRDAAFIVSDLPIIVSLEIHASLDQQEVMVEIMQQAWAGLLVSATPGQDIKELPSPEQLKRKILIKVKWSPPSKENTNDPTVVADQSEGSSDDKKSFEEKSEQKRKSVKILQSLSDLGVYTRAYSFKRFDQPESRIPVHVFSLSERKVKEMYEHDESALKALFEHNRDFLMRVFPSGMRVTSSNMYPLSLWRQGVQMVALNWQSWDDGMMLNEAMFANQQGWVLKPSSYLGRCKSPEMHRPTQKRRLDLKIELLALQNLPVPEIRKDGSAKLRPYMQVDLHVDTPATNLRHEDLIDKRNPFKKRSGTSGGVDADLSGEQLEFSDVSDITEELSFVRYVLARSPSAPSAWGEFPCSFGL